MRETREKLQFGLRYFLGLPSFGDFSLSFLALDVISVEHEHYDGNRNQIYEFHPP